jgi:uncharacterized protein (TIGR02147 family)
VSVFKHLKYRSAIEEVVESRRNLPGKFTLRSLAFEAGMQASFLTNVLKGRFDFNADQMFALTQALGLSSAERDYLMLLLEHERSVFKARKEELKKKIEEIRKENQKSEKHLSVKAVELSSDAQAQYYLDPFAQLTLVYLNLAPYSKSPEKLGSTLGISQQHLGEILQILTTTGDVVREGMHYKVVARNRHLPKRNPLSGPHLTMMRLKSIDQLQRLSVDQSYSHSVTFTGTEETKEALSDAYLSFLKKAESIVRPAKSEKVFQMSFDLFPWDL